MQGHPRNEPYLVLGPFLFCWYTSILVIVVTRVDFFNNQLLEEKHCAENKCCKAGQEKRAKTKFRWVLVQAISSNRNYLSVQKRTCSMQNMQYMHYAVCTMYAYCTSLTQGLERNRYLKYKN